MRMHPNRWAQIVTQWEPDCLRNRGRPRTRWHRDLDAFKLDWREVAQDREARKDMGETSMKATLALAVLAIIATATDSSVVRVSSRSNLVSGYVSQGDRLLYRSYIYQPPIVNSVQYQDVVYRGNATTRITAVQATEVGATQWATAYILQGGVGRSNVTVRFTSARGYGYYYLLDIWGR